MRDKAARIRADIRRKLIKGATPHKIARRVILHTKLTSGEDWFEAASAQLVQMLEMSLENAKALVREMSC